VFVDHRRNDRRLREVAHTPRKLGLTPVVPRDRPNQRRANIETIEDHKDAGAIALLLAGDGVAWLFEDDEPTLKPRAAERRLRAGVRHRRPG
jgi:hypothetical protein